MIFGLMRKTTHDAIVAELEARIDYLETKSYGLSVLADARLEKLEKVEGEMAKLKAPAVKATPVAAPAKVMVEQPKQGEYVRLVSTARSPSTRLNILETVLPKAKFQIKGNAIRVLFNGKPARVRVAQPTYRKDTDKTFTFLNIVPGDICVALNEDQSLRSVFVAKRDMITSGGGIFLVRNSERDINAIQNTNLVLRNFK